MALPCFLHHDCARYLFGKMHPTLAAGPTLISHVLEHVLNSFNTAGKLPFFGKVHVPKLTWFS